MDDFQRYVSGAAETQVSLVRDVALALSRHYGFEKDFLALSSAPEAAGAGKNYRDSILARNQSRLDAIAGIEPSKWEAVLEAAPAASPLPPHPDVEAFNRLAKDRGLKVRLHDSGPKDYSIAKIKALKIHGGDLSRLDDINRIMVETGDPDADMTVGGILASMRGIARSARQESRNMQGFVSDVYRLNFDNGGSAEIAFVPYGLVASSAVTHNALRFRRASASVTDAGELKNLYRGICENIREKFNAVSGCLKVDPKHVAALDLPEFSLNAANDRLKTLENACLDAVLGDPVNGKWRAFLGARQV